MKLVSVPINKINVGMRYRENWGDIEGLAANIRDLGLLQPIGIDQYYEVIFGVRRLHVCRDILHWKEMPCVMLQIESLLAGEYAENEFRKDFTPSERAAIGRAIEREIGNRQAQGRPKVAANAATYPQVVKNPVKSKSSAIAEQLPKGKTADLAAKRAGFKSAESFERAKTVTERGTSELIAAMDEGKVSISAAAAIASQPAPDQQRIISMPKDERREIVQQIRKTRADREEDQKYARDVLLFVGLENAVKFLAEFAEPPQETWAGLSRVSAGRYFTENLDRALECLARIRKAHPNEPARPQAVAKSS